MQEQTKVISAEEEYLIDWLRVDWRNHWYSATNPREAGKYNYMVSEYTSQQLWPGTRFEIRGILFQAESPEIIREKYLVRVSTLPLSTDLTRLTLTYHPLLESAVGDLLARLQADYGGTPRADASPRQRGALRGPTIETLRNGAEALRWWVDESKNQQGACQLAGIDPKTLRSNWQEICDYVAHTSGEATAARYSAACRARWEPIGEDRE